MLPVPNHIPQYHCDQRRNLIKSLMHVRISIEIRYLPCGSTKRGEHLEVKIDRYQMLNTRFDCRIRHTYPASIGRTLGGSSRRHITDSDEKSWGHHL